MRLLKFKVEKYKRIDQATIDFSKDSDNITVLAGQNESGKSSVLEALETFYQECFSEDSLPLLKEENLDKQSATFEFSLEPDDVNKYCDGLASVFTAEEEFWRVLKEEFGKSTIMATVTFYLTNQSKEGIFLNKEHLAGLRNFINSKYSTYRENNKVAADVEQVEPPVLSDSEGEAAEVAQKVEEALFISDELAFAKKCVEILYSIAPSFYLFSDSKCDLLPDNIKLDDYVNEKGDGVSAVSNLEKIFGTNFVDIAAKGTREKNTIVDKHNQTLTADFEKVFRQKIHGENSVKISYDIDALSKTKAEKLGKPEDIGMDFIYFSVETHDGEPLPLRLRSKGLVWFLSFWLILESLKDEKHIILIDEPDSSLHVNAQEDLMKVLEDIANKKGHQIIYSTHSPFLIPTDNLHRVKLVYNDGKDGVGLQDISEDVDTVNKKEALLPVFHAIGCAVAKNNAIFNQKNVIVEGLSDLFAYQAMGVILGREQDLHFLPGIGTKGDKLNPIIGMCLGYGLSWCLVMDNDSSTITDGLAGAGTYPEQKFNLIKNEIFGGDEAKTKKKVYILEKGTLEDLFTIGDIEMIAKKIGFKLPGRPTSKNNQAFIGRDRKTLFWKLFLSAVSNKKIKSKELSDGVKAAFEKIFNFAQTSLSFTMEEIIEG